MERLWWFCLWLWEWFWHPQGMLVWAEANQGLLSIAALVSALVLALIEQKRALIAEQFARDADAAADRRALEASRDADRRAREAIADADRKAAEASAQADRKAAAAIAAADRKAELAAKRATDNAMREYIDVIIELLDAYVEGAKAARIETESKNSIYSGQPFQITAWMHDGKEIISIIQAILPAAPRSPGLILATQRIANILSKASNLQNYTNGDSHLYGIDDTMKHLKKQIDVIKAHRPEETRPERVKRLRRRTE